MTFGAIISYASHEIISEDEVSITLFFEKDLNSENLEEEAESFLAPLIQEIQDKNHKCGQPLLPNPDYTSPDDEDLFEDDYDRIWVLFKLSDNVTVRQQQKADIINKLFTRISEELEKRQELTRLQAKGLSLMKKILTNQQSICTLNLLETIKEILFLRKELDSSVKQIIEHNVLIYNLNENLKKIKDDLSADGVHTLNLSSSIDNNILQNNHLPFPHLLNSINDNFYCAHINENEINQLTEAAQLQLQLNFLYQNVANSGKTVSRCNEQIIILDKKKCQLETQIQGIHKKIEIIELNLLKTETLIKKEENLLAHSTNNQHPQNGHSQQQGMQKLSFLFANKSDLDKSEQEEKTNEDHHDSLSSMKR